MALEERAGRITDLATGFALGELDESELRELYDALRAPDAAGAEAARLTWQMLGATIDIKAQVSHAFQDELLMKLHAEAGGDQASARAFTDRLRARLGQARPGLAPVPTPPPPPAGRRAALVIAAMAGVLIAAAAVAWWAWPPADPVVARVVGLHGSASQRDRALTPGSGIDRRPLTVPDGGQISLAWSGGGRATIAGPARLVAGPGTLAVLAGRAWVEAGTSPFALALPDHEQPAALSAGGRLALEVRDGRTLLAVGGGSLDFGQRGVTAITAGNAVALGRGAAYAWRRQVPAAGDAMPLAAVGGAVADWRLGGGVHWPALESRLRLRLDCAGGRQLDLVLEPGSAALVLDGTETQRVTLAGAPLAPRILAVDGSDSVFHVALAGAQLMARPPAAPLTLTWISEGGARLADAVMQTGPDAEPPLPAR